MSDHLELTITRRTTLLAACVLALAGCGTKNPSRSCLSHDECAPGFCVDGECTAPAPQADGGGGGGSGDGGLVDPRGGGGVDCEATPPVLSSCGDCDPNCRGTHVGVGGFDPEADDTEGLGLAPDGSLVLESRRVETAFIWIANTGQGTVSKVDTRTQMEVARYRTGPNGAGEDPSRTSINTLGDAYVANRGSANAAARSVTKISVLGEDCPDTNGDGVITTSSGPTDVLPWGQDDCVLWRTPLTDGGMLRALAAQDVRGPDAELFTYVWVGGWSGLLWKLNGETGAIEVRTQSPTQNYGFALDGLGNLWISGRGTSALGRVDTNRCASTEACNVTTCTGADGATCVKQRISMGTHDPYGITVDGDQRVWIATHGTQRIARYTPSTNAWDIIGPAGVGLHGIAADGAGSIWVAAGLTGVARVNADTMEAQIVPGTNNRGTNGAKGVAVDFDGRVWVINLSTSGGSDATVITPGPTLADNTVERGVAHAGAVRYTYSDMTGTQLRLATDPSGRWRRPFEGCADGADTIWRELRFTGEVPLGTRMRFRARTAATRAELAAATWAFVGEVPDGASPLDLQAAFDAAAIDPQPWIEVEAQLEATRTSWRDTPISPKLRSLTVTHECPVQLL